MLLSLIVEPAFERVEPFLVMTCLDGVIVSQELVRDTLDPAVNLPPPELGPTVELDSVLADFLTEE